MGETIAGRATIEQNMVGSGGFPATAKLRHPIVQIEPQTPLLAGGQRVRFRGLKRFLPSRKSEKTVHRGTLAWGVLLGVVSEITDKGKRTKGAVRLEGTLQGPGGTLQH
jgi:hypothetical protein